MKYITYTVEERVPGEPVQDGIVNVSCDEAVNALVDAGIPPPANLDDLANRYAEHRGWTVVGFSIGNGSQGGPE